MTSRILYRVLVGVGELQLPCWGPPPNSEPLAASEQLAPAIQTLDEGTARQAKHHQSDVLSLLSSPLLSIFVFRHIMQDRGDTSSEVLIVPTVGAGPPGVQLLKTVTLKTLFSCSRWLCLSLSHLLAELRLDQLTVRRYFLSGARCLFRQRPPIVKLIPPGAPSLATTPHTLPVDQDLPASAALAPCL